MKTAPLETRWEFAPLRITICRQLLGISPAVLARKIGVTAGTVRNWEAGKGAPDGFELARMANTLRMTPFGFFEKQG